MFLPVRIRIEKRQTVNELLQICQLFQNQKLSFEHLGWLELRELDEIKPIVPHAINMNINIQPLKSLAQKLDLEFCVSHSMCDDPFGINIDTDGDEIKWTVYYDARFIDKEIATSLLRDLQTAFFLVVNSNTQSDFTVADVLRSI